MHLLFSVQIICPPQCYANPHLSFWYSLYYSFWLLFLSCKMTLFSLLFSFYGKREDKFLFSNFCSYLFLSLSIDVKKSAKSFLDLFLGFLQTLCARFAMFFEILRLNLLLCCSYFRQTGSTCFFSSIFKCLAFKYIRR